MGSVSVGVTVQRKRRANLRDVIRCGHRAEGTTGRPRPSAGNTVASPRLAIEVRRSKIAVVLGARPAESRLGFTGRTCRDPKLASLWASNVR